MQTKNFEMNSPDLVIICGRGRNKQTYREIGARLRVPNDFVGNPELIEAAGMLSRNDLVQRLVRDSGTRALVVIDAPVIANNVRSDLFEAMAKVDDLFGVRAHIAVVVDMVYSHTLRLPMNGLPETRNTIPDPNYHNAQGPEELCERLGKDVDVLRCTEESIGKVVGRYLEEVCGKLEACQK